METNWNKNINMECMSSCRGVVQIPSYMSFQYFLMKFVNFRPDFKEFERLLFPFNAEYFLDMIVFCIVLPSIDFALHVCSLRPTF